MTHKKPEDYWIFFHPITAKEITEPLSLEEAVNSVYNIRSGRK